MKQVLVVNASLKLPKGKLAAQAAHAAVAAFLEAGEDEQQAWLDEGMPKIVVAAPADQDLLALLAKAQSAGIAACLIEDAGRTVVPEGTITCLGLGPAEDEALDKITGELKLL
jgi:peptidyl-tRNA hydrolase, PTH2 family